MASSRCVIERGNDKRGRLDRSRDGRTIAGANRGRNRSNHYARLPGRLKSSSRNTDSCMKSPAFPACFKYRRVCVWDKGVRKVYLRRPSLPMTSRYLSESFVLR